MTCAYLFDLDGTLLDSMHLWDDVGIRFLNQHHIEVPIHINDIIKDMSFAQSAKYFITLGNLSMSVKEVCEEIYQMVAYRYAQEVSCKKGVTAFLKQAQAQDIPMGIVTALDKDIASAALKHNKIDAYFSFILTCDEIKKGKDEPDIYLEGAKRLGVVPHHIYVFEDALYCMKTAKNASFHVIGVFDETQHISDQDKQKYCECFVYDFDELLIKEKNYENSINNSRQ